MYCKRGLFPCIDAHTCLSDVTGKASSPASGYTTASGYTSALADPVHVGVSQTTFKHASSSSPRIAHVFVAILYAEP